MYVGGILKVFREAVFLTKTFLLVLYFVSRKSLFFNLVHTKYGSKNQRCIAMENMSRNFVADSYRFYYRHTHTHTHTHTQTRTHTQTDTNAHAHSVNRTR